MRSGRSARKLQWLTAAAAIGCISLTMAGASPVRAAHESTSVTSKQIPLPPINTRLYDFCKQNTKAPGQPPAATLSTYLAGFSDSGKLGGALPSGFPHLALAQSEGTDEGFWEGVPQPDTRQHIIQCVMATLQLDYHGPHGNQHLHELPPVKVTLMAFGFEPVTATATLVQPPPAKHETLPPPLTAIIYQDQGIAGAFSLVTPFTVVATAQLELKLSDVTVNGAPVNVGSSCRTNGLLRTPNNHVAPGEVVLTGGTKPNDPQPGYAAVNTGGALEGVATVPPFVGCVTPSGENLDPLLTAAASGPGNFIKIDQGPSCENFGGFGFGCVTFTDFLPPDLPIFTVRHGGSYSSSAPFVISQFGNSPVPGVTISCDKSTITGEFPDASGPLRGALGTVRWATMPDCQGTITNPDGSTAPGGTWKVAQDGTAYFGGMSYSNGVTINPATTQADAVGNVMLELTGTGGPINGTCHATLFGPNAASYTNHGSVLNIIGTSGNLLNVDKGCAGILPAPDQPNFGPYAISATYNLKPGGMTITSPPAPTH